MTKQGKKSQFQITNYQKFFFTCFKLSMKVSAINHEHKNNNTFKSGLTSELLKCEKSISPANVKNFFINKSAKDFGAFYNIDLKGNKAHALAPDCKSFIKDPMELLNKTPKEFQKILQKASNIKFIKG